MEKIIGQRTGNALTDSHAERDGWVSLNYGMEYGLECGME